MTKTIFSVGLALFVAQALAAQAPDSVAPGTMIRISTQPVSTPDVQLPSQRIVGTFSRFAGDTLYVAVGAADAAPQYYAARNILRIEQSVGTKHPYIKGAVFGTLLGATVGYWVGRITKPQPRCTQPNGVTICYPADESKTAWKMARPGGAVLGLSGGLFIAHRINKPIWKQVSLSTFR